MSNGRGHRQGAPSIADGLRDVSMSRIRRPRKIVYLIMVFALLYWYSFRHGLGEERALSHYEQLRAERLAKAAAAAGLPLDSGLTKAGHPHVPIRVVKGAKQVGSGGGAEQIWENTFGRVGLGRWSNNGKGHKVGPEGKKVEHRFNEDGLVEVRATETAEHPIYDLMEQARNSFDGMLARQSKTLKQAVEEYKSRYGMPPPKGFDAWWKFVIDEDIKIVDDYDRIYEDIIPFHALHPSLFRQRAEALKGTDFTWTFRLTPNAVEAVGPRAEAGRPQSLKGLFDGFRHRLPEDFDIEFTGSDHDLGSWILGDDQRERAMELVQEGRHFTMDELKELQSMKRTPVKGWFSACKLDSPANIKPWAENATEVEQPKSFIHHHQATMNFCQHPSLKRLHGALSLDYPGRTPSELRPLFVLSKFANNGEIVQTPLQAYKNLSDLIPSEFSDWSEKTYNRVFWRGSSTGGFNVQRPWQDSHRTRLHLMVNGKKFHEHDLKEDMHDVMMPDGYGGFEVQPFDMAALANAYTDIGLAGSPHQVRGLSRRVLSTLWIGRSS